MKKKTILSSVLLLTVLATASFAFADGDDFSASDYQKVLNGNKNMTEARLEGADFKGKNLSGYNFTNADLEGANFQGANLSNTNFAHADLDKVKMQGANLTNTNFYHADLEEANLKGATIKGANFKETELEYTVWTDGRLCAEGSIGGCW